MVFEPRVRENADINESAFNLVNSFEKGVFDALDKNYLERLMLNIHSDDPNRNPKAPVIESYSFKFSHTNDETFIDGRPVGKSKDEIQASTKALLKKLVMLTQALETLPEKTWIGINLLYGKKTPVDYEPDLFEPIKRMNLPDFEENPLSIELGDTDTGIDRIVVKLRIIDKKEFSNPEPEKEPIRVGMNKDVDEGFRNMNISIEPTQIQTEEPKRNEIKKSCANSFNNPDWTEDSMVGNQENFDPESKASRTKRKVECQQSSRKARKLNFTDDYKF